MIIEIFTYYITCVPSCAIYNPDHSSRVPISLTISTTTLKGVIMPLLPGIYSVPTLGHREKNQLLFACSEGV